MGGLIVLGFVIVVGGGIYLYRLALPEYTPRERRIIWDGPALQTYEPSGCVRIVDEPPPIDWERQWPDLVENERREPAKVVPLAEREPLFIRRTVRSRDEAMMKQAEQRRRALGP